METSQFTTELSESDVHGIVMKLLDSHELVKNRDIFGGSLGIPLSKLEDIKRNNAIHREDSYGYFKDVITTWISKTKKNDATLDKLIHVLKRNGLFEAANMLDPGYSEQPNEFVRNKILFDLYDPVESFTGREADLEYINLHIKEFKIAISGLGGIGKSEVAKKFAAMNKTDYDSIVWINAENHTTMSSSFKRLAQKKLHISLKYADGNEKDIMDLLEEIYESRLLLYSKTLLIFDNAEQHKSEIGGDGIIQFLPPKNSKIHLLITARQIQWGPRIILRQLETFTKEESKTFVETSLKIHDNSQNEDILKLVHLLQYFPLALQQAVAYIMESNDEIQNVDSAREYTIANYLDEYDIKTQELLDFKFPDHSDDRYFKTTFTTWEITFEKIKKHVNGETAIEIMNMMSYLAPDMIPSKMFLDLLNENEKELGGVLHLCKRYSMLNVTKDGINIHRLVQDVMRLNIEYDGRLNNVLFATLMALYSFIPLNRPGTTYNTTNVMISHMEVLTSRSLKCLRVFEIAGWKVIIDLLDEMKHYLGLVYIMIGKYGKAKQILEEELSRKENLYGKHGIKLCDTIKYLAILFGEFEDYKTVVDLLKRSLKIEEDFYGLCQIESADTLSCLGATFSKLGDSETAKNFNDRALMIMRLHYKPDDIRLALAIANTAEVYGMLGDHTREREMYESALHIEEKYYSPEHICIAITLGDLGNAFRKLGEFEKAKELQEKALLIQEKFYGTDHMELSSALAYLGSTYLKLGLHEKAKDVFERVLRIAEKHYGRNHVELTPFLTSLGYTSVKLGDYSSAKDG